MAMGHPRRARCWRRSRGGSTPRIMGAVGARLPPGGTGAFGLSGAGAGAADAAAGEALADRPAVDAIGTVGRIRVAIGTVGVAIGAGAILIGVALPWVILLHGRLTVNGVTGDGAYLAAAAVGAVGLWATYLVGGRSGPMRALTAGAGFLVMYWAFFDTWRLVSYVAGTAAASPLGGPVVGPGSLLAGLGGIVLVISALSVPAAEPRSLSGRAWLRLALGAALLAAGGIHLQQTPDHLSVATLLGLGFIAAAASQMGLAVMVLVRGHWLLYVAVIADCSSFFVIYVYAVLHGLPFPPHDDAGLKLGAGEAVTLSGALSEAFEVLSIMLAVLLLPRPPRRQDALSSAGSASRT